MNYTKKIGLALAAAAAFGAGAALMAQDQQAAPPPPPPQAGAPMGPGGMHHGDGEMRRMTEELNLTPEQRQQVKGIMETRRQKGEAIRSNTALSPEQQRQQMMALHQETQGQIRGLLTPEQQQKFDAMQHHMGKHPMQPPPGGPAPPPPPPQQ